MHVLLVLGGALAARELAACLRRDDVRVDVSATLEDGIWLAGEVGFDAIVTDRSHAAGDAVDFCATLRTRGIWTPILFLAPTCDDSCVQALDAGADDCQGLPLRLDELEARLRALVRRGQADRPCVLTVGSLRLDPAARTVFVDGRPLPIMRLPFDILELLMRGESQVVTRQQIADHVWDWA